MEILSPKQDRVLKIIQKSLEANSLAPSLSELQEALLEAGMAAKSKRSVVQYLETLEKKGYITRTSEERGIRLIKAQENDNFVDVPIMGTANAGAALVFAEENIQGFIKASKLLLKSVQSVFALQISGDSMNSCTVDRKYIEDGDYVVVDKSIQNFQNDDIVLAIIDGCATIKKLKKTMFGEVILLPQSNNPIHQPIYIHEDDQFFLNGKVINVLKAAKNL